jgi:hypothetical protein
MCVCVCVYGEGRGEGGEDRRGKEMGVENRESK